MMIPSDAELLQQVESFLARTKMAPSRLGLDALSDGAVIFQMRDGKRSLTLKSAQKLIAFMTRVDADAASAGEAIEA